MGASNDLQIYHDGSHNIINGAAGQNLEIQTNAFRVNNQADNEQMIVANANGGVELYYDNSKILDTQSWGVDITGTVEADQYNLQDSDGTTQQIRIGAAGDLRLYHTGSDSVINQTTQNDLEVLHGTDTMAKFVPDGEVELYYDNSKKFETKNHGVDVTGLLQVNGNVAPSADNTHNLGTTSEKWAQVHATTFHGDGSNLTGISAFVSGMIMLWSGAQNAIPTGWYLCDGNNSTPDLRDRFVVGAGNSYSVGDNGGNNTVTVSGTTGGHNQPSASSTYFRLQQVSGSYDNDHTHSFSGSGDNRPPYYALCYIMKS